MSGALPPGSTIGILGGGQLGRMLAVAAALALLAAKQLGGPKQRPERRRRTA